MRCSASKRTPMAHGVLIDQRESMIILGLPGTDYQIHLRVENPIAAARDHLITGTIQARARRVDLVQAGGKFIEPVYGRPRRLQGTILASDPSAGTILVDCSCPFVCHLTTGQKTTSFTPGMLVCFDIESGATFESD